MQRLRTIMQMLTALPQHSARMAIVAALGLVGAFGAHAQGGTVTTASRVIDGLIIETPSGSGSVNYYLFTSAGWGATGCPGAQYAYITTNTSGAKEVLALALQARQVGRQVYMTGSCNGSGFFVIKNLYG